MIYDAIPYWQCVEKALRNKKFRLIRPFVELIERQLGAKVLFDLQTIPHGRYDLIEPLAIAESFIRRRILRRYDYSPPVPDEPPIRSWYGLHPNEMVNAVGGISLESDEAALYAMLGESLERYLWFEMMDYFEKPVRATMSNIVRKGAHIAPHRFCGFSEQQRASQKAWTLSEDAEYLWIRGVSLIAGKKMYIPAQTVSKAISALRDGEPLIREQTTIGLATWPTELGARLRGLLEVIERDAYMIMWLNQLTLPRVILAPLAREHQSIDRLIKKCEQYRLKLHAVRLLTDAPAHVICVVLEDMSDHAPRFAFGLRAHRSLPEAIRAAALEALRARRHYRAYVQGGGSWDPDTPAEKIGHRERTFYWGHGNNAEKLEFMVAGIEEGASGMWEHDTEEEHFERLIEWCKEKAYECIAVDLGRSKANPTPWHVQKIVMPDMQSPYLREWTRHLGGKRLQSVPKQYGYVPRIEPFVDAPHPYC